MMNGVLLIKSNNCISTVIHVFFEETDSKPYLTSGICLFLVPVHCFSITITFTLQFSETK